MSRIVDGRFANLTSSQWRVLGCHCGTVVVLVVIVVVSCREVLGATLVDVRVVMDGSAEPPGDRLDVSLILSEDEPTLTLELRAFTISEDENSKATRIRTRGNLNRDRDGNFLAVATAERPQSSGVSGIALVVPYSDLDLPVGKHQLAYEIRGIRNGRVEFVRATQISFVTVSNETRSELELHSAGPESTMTRTLNVIIGGERTRGEKPKPISERNINVTEAVPGLQNIVEKFRVRIPGGFKREQVPSTEPAEDELSVQAPSRPLSDVRTANERMIYFATNRLPNGKAESPATQFGDELSEKVTWGECVVNIPVEHHKSGTLEEPTWWTKKKKADEHFLIESLNVLTREQLRSQVKDGDLLLFIHGYKGALNNKLPNLVLHGMIVFVDASSYVGSIGCRMDSGKVCSHRLRP